MSDRIAIVTGGGSGIGRAIGLRLASDGNMVAIFDLDGDAAAATADTIVEAGGKALGVQVDVTDRANIDAGVAEVRSRLGRPTVLVNNAGLSLDSPFLDITAELWQKSLAVNLTAHTTTIRACPVVRSWFSTF